jgi:hypothetical protein
LNNIESQIEALTSEEEPYVGMPISSLANFPKQMPRDPLAGLPLAMAYVPWQCWCETYKPAEGWRRGTIFPELDLPFLGGGEC